MQINDVVMVSAVRTAIGKFMGGLKDVQARDLAITAGSAAIERSGISADSIDEITMGELYTAMQGSLPARQVGIRLGLPDRSGAVSVNQNCSSGMRALEIAAHNIMLGKTEIALVVGVESMTNAPYLLPHARMGYRMNAGTIEDHMIHDGLHDELVPGHMALTAENVAEKYGISRKECDELALTSHTRATSAIEEGRFQREIVPVELKGKKGQNYFFDTDEHPIRDASLPGMEELRPAFKKDGVVTAANASGINDGASAAVAGIAEDRKGPLFRTVERGTDRLSSRPLPPQNAWDMVRRRARQAGIQTRINNHTFRATGITTYLKNGGQLEKAAHMAAHSSTRTTQLYDRRSDEVSLDEVERIVI